MVVKYNTMKKITVIISLLLLSFVLNAQRDTLYYKYCKVVGNYTLQGARLTVAVDSGQSVLLSEKIIKDKDGEKVKFNSDIEAVNWLARNRWELFLVYNYTDYLLPKPEDHTVYIMRKEMKKLGKIYY